MEYEREGKEKNSLYQLIRRCAPVTIIKLIVWDLCADMLPFINVIVIAGFLDSFLQIGSGDFRLQQQSLQALLLLLLYMAVEKACRIRLDFLAIRLKEGIQVKADTMLLEKQASLPWATLEQEAVQDLFSRLTAHPSEKILAYVRALRKLLRFVLEAGSLWLILFLQSPGTALVLLLFFIPVLWMAARWGEMEYDMDETFWAVMRRVRYLQQLMSGRQHIEEREIFQYNRYLDAKWREHMDRMIGITASTGRKSAFRLTLCKILVLLAMGGQMLLLLPSLIRGRMSLGIYIGLIKASHDMIQKVVWELPTLIREIAKGRRYVRDLDNAMGFPEMEGQEGKNVNRDKEEKQDKEDKENKEGLYDRQKVGRIEFRDVTFCYPGSGEAVLRHFSVVFEKNRHYALVGLNGAGKSTMLKLLIGTYRDYEGEILIDGTEIRTMEPSALRDCFTVLFQSYARYEISIREQLELAAGKPLRQEECEAVLRQVGLWEVTASEPEGLDLVLGKTEADGRELSGGQWQRLALARCLMRKAPVCLMDEPTASMDPIGEAAWAEELGEAARGQILIVISHRLGTARKMDEIMVMADGQVAERGGHEELMAKQGAYFELFETQRSWYHEKNACI